MRLEPSHRELVSEHGENLIEGIERGALSLSGAGDHTAALNAILGDVQTFRIAIGSVHDYAPLVPAIDEFEGMVRLMREGQLSIDNKIGRVLLHVVSTFRSALTNLGTASRAGRMLPKVLQDLSRVMSALKQKTSTDAFAAGTQISQPEPGPAPTTQSELTAIADEYSELFLRDEAGLFAQVLELSRHLVADPFDHSVLTELFRMIHTIKGNAMALGFEGMTGYAHAVEDLLYKLQSGHLRASSRVARMVLGCADVLKEVLEDYRRGSGDHVGVDERIAEVRRFIIDLTAEPVSEIPESIVAPVVQATASTALSSKVRPASENLFFLSVRIGGRELLVPCGSVAQVLLSPRVMAIPGGRKGWLGVIRAGNALVPLVDPQALVGVNVSPAMARNPAWSIILAGSTADTLSERSLFAVPVDEVGAVTELPYGIPDMSSEAFTNTTVLDIPAMMKRIW